MTRMISVLSTALVLLTLGAPAGVAAVPESGSSDSDPSHEARRAALVQRAERAYDLSAEGVAGAFRAVTESMGTTAPPAPVVPAAVPGLDASLQAPVGRLLAAIRVSRRMILDALPLDRSRIGEVNDHVIDSLFKRHAHPLQEVLKRAPLGHPRGAQRPILDDARYLRALAVAGATVTEAINYALPLLEVASVPVRPGSGAGCNVFEQAPALCIGGEGPNVLTDDYALVIDLGGDDIHRHSAGGADVFANGLPVAVTIDGEGNDRYESDLAPGVSPVVQGGGLFGMGVLVDAAGDDSYTAATTHPYWSVGAQGVGVIGAGIFADLGGNDRYTMTSIALGHTGTVGQGFGAFGYGVALDMSGDDEYRMVSRSQLTTYGQMLEPGYAAALGFGAGKTGFISEHPGFTIEIGGRGGALFADLDGTDSFDVEATTGTIPPNDFGNAFRREATTMLFGLGEGLGVGLSLSGTGDTARSMRTSVLAPQSRAWAAGFGAGLGFGTGILSDRGGDDTYTTETTVAVERRAVIEDECGCTTAQATADAGELHTMGMGFGGSFAEGLLRDAAGDDTYQVVSSTRSTAEARDLRMPETRTEPASLGAESLSAPAVVWVQGAGVLSGSGTLLDAAGDDRYEVQLTNETVAATDEDAATMEVTAASGDAVVAAQAGADTLGYGELMDLAGRDGYAVFADAPATASPPTSALPGVATAHAQAGSSLGAAASLVDVDDGAEDSFQMTPPGAVCVGARGEDVWVDCEGAVGVEA